MRVRHIYLKRVVEIVDIYGFAIKFSDEMVDVFRKLQRVCPNYPIHFRVDAIVQHGKIDDIELESYAQLSEQNGWRFR